MATYKILGQSNPAATTETTLYTTTAGSSAVISSLTVCNQTAAAVTFRVALRPSADATTTAKHWVIYGSTVPASDSVIIQAGWTLAAGDKIQIYASSGSMSFTVTGSEN